MACNLGCSEPPTVDLARFAEYTNLKSLYNAVIWWNAKTFPNWDETATKDANNI